MPSCSAAEYARGRPALGTLVSIRVTGCSQTVAVRGFERAFARIADIHRAMSFHDDASELSRLNRAPAGAVIRLSADINGVISLARKIFAASEGLFDPSVALTLTRNGFLPASGARATSSGTFRDVEPLSRRRVRLRRPVQLDLGGIAKGYAVDVAVDALRSEGIRSGLVNAGGDLRAFGSVSRTVHVRHPGRPTTLIPLLELQESAVATSATYFSHRYSNGKAICPLVDPFDRQSVLRKWSVSVVAPTCAIADALTKVAYLAGDTSSSVLRQFDATAAILTTRGDLHLVGADAA